MKARSFVTLSLACGMLVTVSAQQQPPAPAAQAAAPVAPGQGAAQGQGQPRPQRPPRPGVQKPGIRREMSSITPIAQFPVAGNPDWQVITRDAVWVTSSRAGTVTRLDPKTNKVAAVVNVGQRPCSGLLEAFGSIWVPKCGDQTLDRIDPKKNEVAASLPIGPANSEGGLAATKDSVWLLSDIKGVLSRIDPDTNKVVAQITVPPGSSVVVAGEDGAPWVVSTEESVVARVDPTTNLVTDRVKVGPNPRFTTVGGGALWTLNQGDGTVTKVDVKTKKFITNIEVGVPGGGGEIAYGGGYVWLTVFEIPITQIDPETNSVVKQWFGDGGDAIRFGHDSIWLSNIRQETVWRIDPKQP